MSARIRNRASTACRFAVVLAAAGWVLGPGEAHAARIFLNPSDQWTNPVCGGGNEAEHALDVANRTAALLQALGHAVIVDQNFYNAPGHANSWGAQVFVSIHSNAGGGHGIETLYSVGQDVPLASNVNAGIVSIGGHSHAYDRGIKYRDNLYVLNNTVMPACLTEVLFHDCCPVEAPFLKTAGGRDIIANGIKNGVCAYLGGCAECTPGDAQNRACPECGWQSRTCDGAGRWSAWSSCTGEPTRACSVSNEWGTCHGSQDCALSGYWSPCSSPAPAEELCDAQDNDCNGEVDDGDPVQMGATVPAYAARVIDQSYPLSLGPGEVAEVWGDFENVGTATWTRRQVWLGSLEAAEGRTSRLYDAEGWAAWDAAAVVEEDVPPGEVVRLTFTIRAPAEPGERVQETFRLFEPGGTPMNCPGPGIEVGLRVLGSTTPTADPVPPEDGTGVGVHDPAGGCGCSVGWTVGRPTGPAGEGGAGPAALLVLLLVLFCGLRRRPPRR